jgi:hypothetical protein
MAVCLCYTTNFFLFLFHPPLLSSMVSCCRRAAFHEFVPIVFYIDAAFHDLPFSRTPQDLFHSLFLGLGRRQVQEGSVDDGCISPPPLISFDRLVDDGSVSPPPSILLEGLDRPVDHGSVSPPPLILLEEDTAE